ncbi:hypothetical protein BVX93_02130 [bacterium B13(2017)]|nr:hypothetical protein BVX93_02130 [bacterium B13(2017)]
MEFVTISQDQRKAFIEWVRIFKKGMNPNNLFDFWMKKGWCDPDKIVEKNMYFWCQSGFGDSKELFERSLKDKDEKIVSAALYSIIWYPDKRYLPIIKKLSFKDKKNKELKKVMINFLTNYDEKAVNKIPPEYSKSSNEKNNKIKHMPEPVDELLRLEIMGLEIGKGLIKIVDSSKGGDLLERINGIRRQFAIDLGFIVPIIRIRDNTQLEANEYHIKIKGDIVGKGFIMPDQYLAMNPSAKENVLEGIQTKEPAFNLPAVWINKNEKIRAEKLKYTVVDYITVLATHLKEIIKKYAHEIFIREDVAVMIENYNKRCPSVLNGIYPEKISLSKIHNIFKNLLRENVSIRDINTIFEAIGDYVGRIKDIDIFSEYIRTYLKRNICQKLVDKNNNLNVIFLDSKLEKKLEDSLQKSDTGYRIVIDADFKKELINKILNEIKNISEKGISPVLLISPNIRLYLKMLIENEIPNIPILSYAEIADNINLKKVSQIKIDFN